MSRPGGEGEAPMRRINGIPSEGWLRDMRREREAREAAARAGTTVPQIVRHQIGAAALAALGARDEWGQLNTWGCKIGPRDNGWVTRGLTVKLEASDTYTVRYAEIGPSERYPGGGDVLVDRREVEVYEDGLHAAIERVTGIKLSHVKEV